MNRAYHSRRWEFCSRTEQLSVKRLVRVDGQKPDFHFLHSQVFFFNPRGTVIAFGAIDGAGGMLELQ